MKAGKPKTYHITRTMLTAMSELYAYIFCMLASRALVGMPIFGGALFMCARVGLAFIAAFADGGNLTEHDISEIRKMIDSYEGGRRK